jgi:hypothetical protein
MEISSVIRPGQERAVTETIGSLAGIEPVAL